VNVKAIFVEKKNTGVSSFGYISILLRDISMQMTFAALIKIQEKVLIERKREREGGAGNGYAGTLYRYAGTIFNIMEMTSFTGSLTLGSTT